MKIIDSHIHICRCINGFGNSGEMQAIGGGYASYADGTIFQMIPECLGEYDVTPEAVLKIMDEAGVSKAVMLQGNFRRISTLMRLQRNILTVLLQQPLMTHSAEMLILYGSICLKTSELRL